MAIHSYAHEHILSIQDVGKARLAQIEEFFVSYNKLRGKKFKVTKVAGPKRAVAAIKEGMAAFKKK